MNSAPHFYLGRVFDPTTGKPTSQPLYYDPADLTTHAFVVGMTGSGKTGLCLTLLEEAALQGIPMLAIDPKGDITNALLHFPDLLPVDFEPWVNPDLARREGKSVPQAAADAAGQWQRGLAEWEISPERLRALQNAAHFAVYTPGSDSGIPVSILASLKCPPLAWDEHRELLREKISGTVTALLGLVGLSDIDPVRSREHILLANIFEDAWKQGCDLDLGELILQTQSPPFPKLGVFDVNAFFPEKDRFDLAMRLNNILAAPAFQSWIEGQPLDVPSLLFAPDGRPRHSIFYIAHLPDAERMFFVSLLLSAVEAWMRTQSGTPALRALVYFDEIFGYLPPIGNPPSKPVMMRLLKQARAFGVGQMLVTQNPADVDYKALSNAGTWFIGKLQTERDKARLLDGLESALAGNLDRTGYDRQISALGKRVFLVHNIHAGPPQLLHTRWAMNYLAGPLTRAQVPALNRLAGAENLRLAEQNTETQPGERVLTRSSERTFDQALPSAATLDGFQPIPLAPEAPPSPPGASAIPVGSKQQPAVTNATRPALSTGIRAYFLPNNLTFTQSFKANGRSHPANALSQGLIYRPALLAQARVRLLNRKYNLDSDLYYTTLVLDPDARGQVRWENFKAAYIDPATLDDAPDPQARFVTPAAPLNAARALSALQSDFLDWVYRSSEVTVRVNETLKCYAGPQVSSAEFRSQCADAARQGRDAELKKLAGSYQGKLKTLTDRLSREERELARDQVEYEQRKWEERGNIAELGAGLLGLGRKKSFTSQLTKRRLTEQAKAEVDESIEAIAQFKQQIADLEAEWEAEAQEIQQRWSDVTQEVSEMSVQPYKKDILLDLFGVAWVPFHAVKIGDQMEELLGYGT
ncbi:MAG: ATP-binding protein [Chloroflexota bacterium]